MSLSVTIGTAPCSWGVWWPDGTPSGTPYSVFLDQAAEAGYKTLELGPVGYLPEGIEELKEELGKRNLGVCGGTACFEFLKAETAEEMRPKMDDICRRLKSFDVPYLMTMDACPMNREEKAKLGDRKDKVYRIFGELGEYCRGEYGIEMLMHPERCSLIETETDLVELIERKLLICLDTGHYGAANGKGEFGDTSASEFMRKYHEYIPYLHFKNYSAEIRRKELEGTLAPDAPEMNDMMCELAAGAIDYADFRKLLDELNFSGVAIVEQDLPYAPAEVHLEMARRNLTYLKEIGMID